MAAIQTKTKAELQQESENRKKADARRRMEEREEGQAVSDVGLQVLGAAAGGALLDDVELMDGVSVPWLGAIGSFGLTMKSVRKSTNLRSAANLGHGMFLGKVFNFAKENNVFSAFNFFTS